MPVIGPNCDYAAKEAENALQDVKKLLMEKYHVDFDPKGFKIFREDMKKNEEKLLAVIKEIFITDCYASW